MAFNIHTEFKMTNSIFSHYSTVCKNSKHIEEHSVDWKNKGHHAVFLCSLSWWNQVWTMNILHCNLVKSGKWDSMPNYRGLKPCVGWISVFIPQALSFPSTRTFLTSTVTWNSLQAQECQSAQACRLQCHSTGVWCEWSCACGGATSQPPRSIPLSSLLILALISPWDIPWHGKS